MQSAWDKKNGGGADERDGGALTTEMCERAKCIGSHRHSTRVWPLATCRRRVARRSCETVA